MEKLNLHLFDATTYTVTCYADAGFSAFSASPASGAKDTEVTLTITPASGYELDEIEVVTGGVTVTGTTTKKITIGEANVVLKAKSKGSKMYKVVENTPYSVNGSGGEVTRNMVLVKGKNGQIIDVNCTATDLSSLSADVLAAMVDSGAVVKV